jgi:hypothetical protein
VIVPAYRVVETLVRVAPLGVGLWDVVAQRLVSDGISVRVFTVAQGRFVRPVDAVANRSGIFVPHGLGGAAVFDESARPRVTSPPQQFLVEVRDPEGRYAPFVLHAGPDRGLVMPPCLRGLELPAQGESSPPPQAVYVPLFATPGRAVPAGMAVVRAALFDAHTGQPAESAVLEVRDAGRLLALGVADEQGEAAAFFAYPEVAAPPAWSPPAPPSRPAPLAEQQWRLPIAVRYRRGLARYLPDARKRPLPDLCELLQQGLAPAAAGSPPLQVTHVDLRYGEDASLGRLLIGPA